MAALNVYLGWGFFLVTLEPLKLRILCLKIDYELAYKVYIKMMYKSTFAYKAAV